MASFFKISCLLLQKICKIFVFHLMIFIKTYLIHEAHNVLSFLCKKCLWFCPASLICCYWISCILLYFTAAIFLHLGTHSLHKIFCLRLSCNCRDLASVWCSLFFSFFSTCFIPGMYCWNLFLYIQLNIFVILTTSIRSSLYSRKKCAPDSKHTVLIKPALSQLPPHKQ